MISFRCGLLAFALAYASPLAAAPQAGDTVELKYEKFELDNGLTVVVHEDRKAPVVAVSVWYRIGSADEPAGKTGFAHLFEHLMFSGSENHKGTYFAPFEKAGATGMNGTTWFDRTNYYETVPTTALDMALWMESDRMGHLLGAIGQKELDAQRGVVQNEKRQGENRPYGRVTGNILKNVFPANHPYHHDAIGSMADLDGASLEDVKNWFRSHYGAANTTIVLAGDITPAQAREKVRKYFGDIPAGPPVARQQPWVTPLAKTTHGVQHDHVAQTTLIRTWVTPQVGNDDALMLELAATVLGGGKTSRLYQRLVYRDKLVDDISANISTFALAGQLQIQSGVRKGIDPAKVDAAIDEEVRRFLTEGPSEDELARARVRYRSVAVRALEGAEVQASVLAEGQVTLGDPGAYRKDLLRVASATSGEIKAASARWLGKGDYRLTVLPAGKDFDPQAEDAKVVGLDPAEGRPAPKTAPARVYSVGESEVDRSKGIPEVTSFPDLKFPAIQRGKLKNGVEVILAEQHAVPVTRVQLVFNAGFSADHGRKLGTAAFTTALLGESTQQLDSVELTKRYGRLGALLTTHCDLDTCNAGLNALNDQLQPALALFADSVRRPAFKAADIDRVRDTTLAALAQSKTTPTGVALRNLPPLLYGKDNAYGIPLDGFGTEDDIKSLAAADFAAFARDWLRPDNMKILVVGDTTLAQIVPLLDATFGDWSAPSTPVPKKNLADVAAQAKPRLFLIDRADAPQSLILAGLLAPSMKAPDHLAFGMANGAFGGSFTSRLNMNLREDKHWAYGARTLLGEAVGQRMMFMYASVQTDKTAESVAEVLKEARAVIADKPLTDEEIAKIKDNNVRALPGAYETGDAVLDALGKIVNYGRSDDYVQTLKARIEGITRAEAESALKNVIKPEAITWMVVGDLQKIEKPLRALGIGEVTVLDADGHARD